jgi:hypothetical protein
MRCSWHMDHLQLEAIRVGEEQCIATRHVIILTRRVCDPAAVPLDFPRKLIHLAATVGGEGDFAASRAMPMELVLAKPWLRFLHLNGAGVMVPSAPRLGASSAKAVCFG